MPRADEPRRHPVFMTCLAAVCLAAVPLPFIGPGPILVGGLPLWLWWSLGWTTILSGLTAFGILRYWKDPDDD